MIVRMGGGLSIRKVGAINFLLQMIAKREGGEIRQLHPIDSDENASGKVYIGHIDSYN